MTRGKKHYRQNIIDGSPVDIYMATPIAMIEYPYILSTPTERRPSSAKQASKFIFDSGIGKDISNKEILENGVELDANYVVPKDIIGDPDKTTDNIVDAILTARNEGIDIPVMIPLQANDDIDRVQHYYHLHDRLNEIGVNIEEEYVAIGGIRDMKVPSQIRCTARVRSKIGTDVTLHAFGCGSHKDWIVAIRKWPDILDSMDTSTPQMNLNNGTVKDASMESRKHFIPRGKNSTVLHAIQLEATVYMINYLTTPYVRDSDAPSTFSTKNLSTEFEKYQ